MQDVKLTTELTIGVDLPDNIYPYKRASLPPTVERRINNANFIFLPDEFVCVNKESNRVYNVFFTLARDKQKWCKLRVVFYD